MRAVVARPAQIPIRAGAWCGRPWFLRAFGGPVAATVYYSLCLGRKGNAISCVSDRAFSHGSSVKLVENFRVFAWF